MLQQVLAVFGEFRLRRRRRARDNGNQQDRKRQRHPGQDRLANPQPKTLRRHGHLTHPAAATNPCTATRGPKRRPIGAAANRKYMGLRESTRSPRLFASDPNPRERALMVGGSGLEPLTSCVSSKYSNQLS